MSRPTHISYGEAIHEALDQAMGISDDVFVFGQGVDNPPGVFHTTTGLAEKYSRSRVFDTPVSESSMTGVALGASLVGMRPVLVHQRLDFMLYSMDQLVNWAHSGVTSQAVGLECLLLSGLWWARAGAKVRSIRKASRRGSLTCLVSGSLCLPTLSMPRVF